MKKIIVSQLKSKNNRLKALSIVLSNYLELFKVDYIPTSILECKKQVIKEINEESTKNIVVTERQIYLSDSLKGVIDNKQDRDGDICTYLNGLEGINNYLRFLKGE